ncbi:MAG: glycine oxidase ThiO [Fimbriimonadales bacterium]|nr:MAG: putative D-amino acid oxidase [Fimbriimonadales bacterium]
MRVLVIGAGVIGAAIAWELRQRGAEVVLLEGSAEGGHTSAASAGMVNPFSLTPDDSPALPLYWQSLQMYPEWTRTLYEQTGIDPEWRQAGCVRIALTDADADHLEASLAWIRRYDPRAERIDSHTARQMEPALNPEIVDAIYIPSEGWVHTARLIRALHRAVQLYGVNLYTGSPALSLIVQSGALRGVQTPHGVMEGDAVVVAAGAWAGALLQPLGIHAPTVPVRGVILALGDLPVPIQHILSMPGGYLVPRADGTALLGATREQAGYDARATAEAYALLMHTLARLAPRLMHATVQGHTVGLRPDTPDHNPYIGAAEGFAGLYLAAGHAYHGILLAPATARALADLILNGATDLPIAPFNPNRFMR